jgi:hypothetical protein
MSDNPLQRIAILWNEPAKAATVMLSTHLRFPGGGQGMWALTAFVEEAKHPPVSVREVTLIKIAMTERE